MNVKTELERRYATEEEIGVYYACMSTDKRQELMTPEERAKADIIAYLPSGEPMGTCTNCARVVASDYPGRADIYGFLCEQNPECTDDEIQCVGGHDFCVVDRRYVVDLWISLYTGLESQVVFDLQDPADRDKITQYFGNPRNWAVIVDNCFVYPTESNYPEEKRLELEELPVFNSMAPV
ncbi:hypothetical protein [Thalassospira xiamenensis]|uniref:Uncharacterized protein n=1 Tax=Thalassospira xiamenensis TaxID=220697 RepID=A0A285U1G5_9PROT|nr:hypothetical protein [Thalassospira xiamenensis]SOC30338.1 hypothetical protein SAMN05428964_1099 [Thalassospira xiamenensis]